MPRASFNTQFAESNESRFKEGFFLINRGRFTVHHPDVPKGQEDRGGQVALKLVGTRLDENHNPMKDSDTDELLKETLYFPLGMPYKKRSEVLAMIHPGECPSFEASQTDEGVEDAGDADD